MVKRVDGGRGSKAKAGPTAIWSDGIHYVRHTHPDDAHPLKWIARAHKAVDSTLYRRFGTMDDALAVAVQATKKWLSTNPADKDRHKDKGLPRNSQLPGPKRKRAGRPVRVKPIPFSTYNFDCIIANPYAQVWQCTSYPGEQKPIGRPPASGKQPKQTSFKHVKGQCAVLIGQEPVRDEDGSIRVFPLWQEAEEHAFELYENAPEDEVITWQPTYGASRVGSTEHFDIMFDPEKYGSSRPFYLWYAEFGKFIYRDITAPSVRADEKAARKLHQLQQTNPAAYVAIKEQRRRERELDEGVPLFSETPLLFRSIWKAAEEAERREAMIRGEVL